MLIVISSTENSKSGKVDLRFGRCKYFALFNTSTKEYSFIENQGINSNKGAGIGAAQSVSDLEADVVLTGNLGSKALEVLNGSQIKGYKVNSLTVEEAVQQFQENQLALITEPSKPQVG